MDASSWGPPALATDSVSIFFVEFVSGFGAAVERRMLAGLVQMICDIAIAMAPSSSSSVPERQEHMHNKSGIYYGHRFCGMSFYLRHLFGLGHDTWP
jgi:hypothetical protein